MQSNYRFKHKDGHYIHLIEQVWVMKMDDKGNPHLILAHVYQLPMIHPFKVNVLVKKLLPDQTYEILHSKAYPEPRQEVQLSRREKEIV